MASSVSAEPTAVVKTFDVRMPVKQFQDAGFTNGNRPDDPPQSLPPVRELDAIFAKAGVASYVKKWDRADKDMLALSAINLPPEELATEFKSIPRDRLLALQASLKK